MRLRETVPSIIDIEYDNDDRVANELLVSQTTEQLRAAGIGYRVYDHGGRCPHIWVRCTGLDNEDDETVTTYKKRFAKKYAAEGNLDTTLFGKHLIALEERPHFKNKYNNAVKQRVETFGPADNPVDSELLRHVKTSIVETQALVEQEQESNLLFFKSFVEHIKHKVLPTGARNNVISKNLGIGLIQFEYPTAEAYQIMDDYAATQNMPTEPVYGWYGKSAKGELKQFNVEEIMNFCIAYGVEIEGFAEFNPTTQWIRLPFNFTWQQAKRVAARAHSYYPDKAFFCTSNEIELTGKLIDSQFAEVEDITVSQVYVGSGDNDSTSLVFYDEPTPKQATKTNARVILSLYTYDFKHNNRTYTLFSDQKLQIGYYTIKGNLVSIDDLRDLGYKAQMKVQTQTIVANEVQSKRVEFKSFDEMYAKTSPHINTPDDLFNWVFSSNERSWEDKSLRHPEEFEWLFTSFLLSGKPNGYPLHLLMIAKPGTGKSRLENAIHWKMDESQQIIEGGGATFKSLLPSFASKTQVKPGALLLSHRVAIIDEFLRILTRMPPDEREDQLGSLNTLLEHNERLFTSAHADITGRMTAKGIFVSNPVRGTKDITGLVESNDMAAFSRFLIHYQDDDHIKYVQNEEGIEQTHVRLGIQNWLGVYDFMNDQESTVDKARVRNIVNTYRECVPPTAHDVYDSRYYHHALALLDGIVKVRSLVNRVSPLVATEEDYDRFIRLWRYIIYNWDPFHFQGMVPQENEHFYTRGEWQIIKHMMRAENQRVIAINAHKVENAYGQPIGTFKYFLKLGIVHRDGNYYVLFKENTAERSKSTTSNGNRTLSGL